MRANSSCPFASIERPHRGLRAAGDFLLFDDEVLVGKRRDLRQVGDAQHLRGA